jgi:hypothetical protein
MSKKCSSCKILKDYNEFHKSKSNKDGYHSTCKNCRKEYNQSNKEKKKEYNKIYWEKNKDSLVVKNKDNRILNVEKIKIQRAKYRSREDVKEHVKQKNKEYLPIRKEKIKQRRLIDSNFRFSEVLRSKIHKMLNGKNTSYKKIIGCDINHLKKWLEYQFDSNMNWNNFVAYRQIDHIIPMSIFNFDNEIEKRICFNWRNLQPLFKDENRSKSNILVLPYVFNNIILTHRFIQSQNLNHSEYQNLKETLGWLREKLRYGKNLQDKNGKIPLKWVIRIQAPKNPIT